MTKTISLADDAYEMLSSMKEQGESFSDVARRLVVELRRVRLHAAAGSWAMSEDEAEDLKRQIRKWRDEGDEGRPRRA